MSSSSPTSSDSPAVPPMANPLGGLLRWALIAILIAAAFSSVHFVDETELVIVERLGVIVAVYDRVSPEQSDRGLHLKLPWPISAVRRFDRRQLLFDPPAREMFTRDRKNVTVSSFLTWRIAESDATDSGFDERPVVKFYRRLGSRATAEARLDARVRAALSAEIGQSDLNTLLQVDGSDQGPRDASLALSASYGQESPTESLGIELVDLRIRRINLPEGNRIAVYERMRTERMRIAERYRSAGSAERARIESQAKRQSDELLARADADAERIRGEGEAEALAILNEAHALDPKLYEYQRTLSAYTQILNRQTTLVLSAGSRLFRVLREGPASVVSSPAEAVDLQPAIPLERAPGSDLPTTPVKSPETTP
ncbi:MAG: protease modulator HflC [Planctomycetota bacterium]|nr:protease modulator HflC [Planctomycetota bacterium]